MDDPLLIAKLTILAFAVIALWHVYMAAVQDAGRSWAVPSRDGRPLFRPTRRATLGVAGVLFLFAALIASGAGLLRIGIPHSVLPWFSYALALGLVGRAVGDFRYVGFFKRVRDSRFARLDSLIFSPLCLLLAAGVLFSANIRAT